MFRFFVDKKVDNAFELSKETLKHIKVARADKEEFICVFEEKFYVCKLEGDLATIINELDENHEYEGEVIIAATYIDTKRFEWLIQKATELGATKLIPMISNNISKKIPMDIEKKLARWNEKARNAAEQSFRNKQMVVEKPMQYADALSINIKNKYIAHEKKDATVKQSFPQNSIFFVGPEGGFDEGEIKLAIENNVEVISLGKRILRAETASMFILSRIN